MTRQKILEQALEPLLAEASPQMRHFEQIVQVVNRRADHAEIFQLLLRFVEMTLNFFELREAVLDILIELHLNRVRDRGELVADVRANALDAFAGLRGQCRNLQLERIRLLLPPGGELFLQLGVEIKKSRRQSIRSGEAEIALRLLHATSEVGARLRQFFIEVARDQVEPLGQLRERIICRKRAQFRDYDDQPRNRQNTQHKQRHNRLRLHQTTSTPSAMIVFLKGGSVELYIGLSASTDNGCLFLLSVNVQCASEEHEQTIVLPKRATRA